MSFVRKSKYRHVFGELAKREFQYEDLNSTSSSLDTNLVKVNNKYISYIMKGAGGGSIALFPIEKVGRQAGHIPVLSDHTRPVTDMDFCPFDPV